MIAPTSQNIQQLPMTLGRSAKGGPYGAIETGETEERGARAGTTELAVLTTWAIRPVYLTFEKSASILASLPS